MGGAIFGTCALPIFGSIIGSAAGSMAGLLGGLVLSLLIATTDWRDRGDDEVEGDVKWIATAIGVALLMVIATLLMIFGGAIALLAMPFLLLPVLFGARAAGISIATHTVLHPANRQGDATTSDLTNCYLSCCAPLFGWLAFVLLGAI